MLASLYDMLHFCLGSTNVSGFLRVFQALQQSYLIVVSSRLQALAAVGPMDGWKQQSEAKWIPRRVSQGEMCEEFLFGFGSIFLKESQMLQWYWVYVLPCQWPFYAESAKRSNDVCKRWSTVTSLDTVPWCVLRLCMEAPQIWQEVLVSSSVPSWTTESFRTKCRCYVCSLHQTSCKCAVWDMIWHDLIQCRLLPVGLPYLIGHWYMVHAICYLDSQL